MDRFEEMQYHIAVEGIGGKILLGTIALIAAATAKTAITSNINEKRKRKYDAEKASGNVSAKTMAKANKVWEGGLPYPEFVAKRDKYKKLAPQVHEIIKKYQKLMAEDIHKLCNSKEEFKPLADVSRPASVSVDDILYSMMHDRFGLVLFMSIDVSALNDYLDEAAKEGLEDNDFGGLHDVASKSDIDAMKKAGIQIIRVTLPKIYSICDKYCEQCANEINRLKDIEAKAHNYDAYNPDDIYKEYGIIFIS